MTKLQDWWGSLTGRDRSSLWRLLAIGFIGVLLLGFGGFGHSAPPKAQPAVANQSGIMTESNQIAGQIESVLSAIPGAGTVKVAVTLSRTVKQEVADTATGSGPSSQPVIVNNGSGQTIVPLDEVGPAVSGVVVVASGATSPEVRTELTEAVETLLQIQAYQVLVLPNQ